jgi:hypothetical protein
LQNQNQELLRKIEIYQVHTSIRLQTSWRIYIITKYISVSLDSSKISKLFKNQQAQAASATSCCGYNQWMKDSVQLTQVIMAGSYFKLKTSLTGSRQLLI